MQHGIVISKRMAIVAKYLPATPNRGSIKCMWSGHGRNGTKTVQWNPALSEDDNYRHAINMFLSGKGYLFASLAVVGAYTTDGMVFTILN